MARFKPVLTDEMWARIEPLLPKFVPSPKGGHPRRGDRQCLEAVLWVLRSGARWRDIPEPLPSASTCWRRLRFWQEREVWLNIWRAFLERLDEKGRLVWEETFGDATFVAAKKGAKKSGKPSAARVRSLWWWRTARVFLWEFSSPTRRRAKPR